MRNKRIFGICLCILALALSLSSCTLLSSSKREKETVLKIGGYDVPYELYYYLSENMKVHMPKATEEEIEAEVFDTAKELYAVFSVAEDMGIAYDDEYIDSIVDDAVSAAIEECGSKSEYKKALRESYMNDSVFRFLEKHSRTADEVLSAIIDSNKYPHDEDGIVALAMSYEFVCVKQVLVVSENSVNVSDDTFFTPAEKHTDEEALAIAKKVKEKADNGEDFDALVKEFGESLYMFNNTDGYYVCRGMWESVNEDAVFSLNEGEISEVIESPSGYSVFLRCKKNENYIRNNADTIANSYYRAVYNLLLEERAEEMTVEKAEAYESLMANEEK